MGDCDDSQYVVGAVLLQQQEDKNIGLGHCRVLIKKVIKGIEKLLRNRKGMLRRGVGGLHSAPLHRGLSLHG